MRSKHREFTESEDQYIREHFSSMSYRDIAKYLDRPERSIDSRGRKLGLAKWTTRPFSPEEDEIIRTSHGRTSVAVAEQLGRAPSVVRLRARRLGIKSWFDITPKRDDWEGYKLRHGIKDGQGKRIGRSLEHRCIMEEYLGRRLVSGEVVHHINCAKRDNRIENLHLCASMSDHCKIHTGLLDLIPELLENGYIEFDRTEGVYRVCKTSK